VRPDEKRTAKGLPCVFGPLPCAVSRSVIGHYSDSPVTIAI
jgi:hypothetical protein